MSRHNLIFVGKGASGIEKTIWWYFIMCPFKCVRFFCWSHDRFLFMRYWTIGFYQTIHVAGIIILLSPFQ